MIRPVGFWFGHSFIHSLIHFFLFTYTIATLPAIGTHSILYNVYFFVIVSLFCQVHCLGDIFFQDFIMKTFKHMEKRILQ